VIQTEKKKKKEHNSGNVQWRVDVLVRASALQSGNLGSITLLSHITYFKSLNSWCSAASLH